MPRIGFLLACAPPSLGAYVGARPRPPYRGFFYAHPMKFLRQKSLLAAIPAALLLALGPREAFAPGTPAPFACVPAAGSTSAAAEEPGRAPEPERQALASEISRRFAIATEPAARIVDAAYDAADEAGLDPLLVLAVISVESRFNPYAQSALGAKGLMQIVPKYHRRELAAFGGDAAVLDPEANVHVGARILQHYVKAGGTLEGGLQIYAGAIWDDSAQYARKVLAQRERLERALPPAARQRVDVALTNSEGS